MRYSPVSLEPTRHHAHRTQYSGGPPQDGAVFVNSCSILQILNICYSHRFKMEVKAFLNGVSTNSKARRTGSSRLLGGNFSSGSHRFAASVILCFVGVNLFVAPEAFALTPAEGEPLRMPAVYIICFP